MKFGFGAVDASSQRLPKRTPDVFANLSISTYTHARSEHGASTKTDLRHSIWLVYPLRLPRTQSADTAAHSIDHGRSTSINESKLCGCLNIWTIFNPAPSITAVCSATVLCFAPSVVMSSQSRHVWAQCAPLLGTTKSLIRILEYPFSMAGIMDLSI